MRAFSIAVLVAFIALVSAKVHFVEEFKSGWEDKWVVSNWKESEGTRGEFKWTAGKYFGDEDNDKGIQTSPDARFYAISAKFPKFSNKGKDLVLQYTVKHEQNLDCGGAYIKLLPSTVDQKSFSGDSQYDIMFGPDICGSSTKKVHLIFNYKGENHLLKKNVPCETDQTTHLYTVILHPDNTYEIQVDEKEVAKGNLSEDWDLLKPKQIKDPKASKPSDWVDDAQIDDPEDHKPEGHDDVPATIADPDATKPDDWDDELDGEWEAPTISNPAFKGAWKAKRISNPAFKGAWEHPLIDNPDYVEDANLYLHEDIGAVGFELWQVKAGTIFDNILVADSLEDAKDHAAKTWSKTVAGEKKAKEEDDKKHAEEAAAQEVEDDAEDDQDDHDHHDHDHDEL